MTHSQLTESVKRAASECASKHPLSPSGDSTASSASYTSSSDELRSTQSSTPPSVKSATLNWNLKSQDRAGPRSTAYSISSLKQLPADGQRSGAPAVTNASRAVPADQRKNPRRTQPAGRTDGKGQSEHCAPPSLVRQSDRKGNFVEILVDTTSQMIEVIWPLSMVPCGRDSFGGKNLIGLRLFIQEVLRRSKTSYSTLQVALYYLVLIKPCIPKVDFTKEQLEDSHTARAMQCGRRMFLAALILASKYLQDRTYSARAWSKISGLSTAEINSNEIAFVTAVDWKLHIPEPLFQRWTDIVLKYSLCSAAPQAQRNGTKASWRSIINQLTPALDTVDISDVRSSNGKCSPQMSMSPPPSQKVVSDARSSVSHGTVATPKPEALEPNLSAPKENYKFPPISPKITQLPTPQMTPNNKAFCTPAVSAKGSGHERSMSQAMRQASSLSMQRCTLDSWPANGASMPQHSSVVPAPCARRTAILPASSLVSSPESMISDTSSQSSRSSRSSSISSVASCVGALPQPRRLAVQATCRYANLYAANGKRDVSHSARSVSPNSDMWACVNPFSGTAEISYLRGQSEDCDAAAAVALQDLALASSGEPTSERFASPIRNDRKRERSTSSVDSHLQEKIQGLLRRDGHCRLPNNDSFAAQDIDVAKTFLLRSGHPVALSQDADDLVQTANPNAGSQTGSRKRVCCA